MNERAAGGEQRAGAARRSLLANRWFHAFLWTCIVLALSTDLLSSQNTGNFLATLIGRFVSPATVGTLNFLIRKGAHLTEYGIAGALYFRALRGERMGWRWSWAVAAVAIACAVASLDEWHQTFTVTRTGTPKDVVLDTAGAAIAQAFFAIGRRTGSQPVQAG